MYTIKGKTYADAGHVLQKHGIIAWQDKESSDYVEQHLDLENLYINGNFVKIDGVVTRLPNTLTYASLKTHFIHLRYTNDDQIAIILNKDDSDEDAFVYNKMQEWREWCGNLAKKCLETING